MVDLLGAVTIRMPIIVFGFLLLGLAVAVFIEWGRVYLKHQDPAPLHIALVSVSYSMLVLGTQYDFYLRETRGMDITWRSPWYLAAYVVGFVALAVVLIKERRRYDAKKPRRRREDFESLRRQASFDEETQRREEGFEEEKLHRDQED